MPPVRQRDADLAGKIQPAARVLDGKVIDVDLGPVVHRHRFARQAGLIRHLRQIQCRRADDQRQKDRKMCQKAAVAAEAVFRKDLAPADFFGMAVHGKQMLAQLLHALRREEHRVRQP